eukprot:406100-Karenia_brevis.AAC.1
MDDGGHHNGRFTSQEGPTSARLRSFSFILVSGLCDDAVSTHPGPPSDTIKWLAQGDRQI